MRIVRELLYNALAEMDDVAETDRIWRIMDRHTLADRLLDTESGKFLLGLEGDGLTAALHAAEIGCDIGCRQMLDYSLSEPMRATAASISRGQHHIDATQLIDAFAAARSVA